MDLKTFIRTNADRVVAVVLVVAGLAAVVIGWFGASGTGLAVEQIPYLISGGIGGVVLIVVGCTAWASADLQDEWRQLDAVERHLEELVRSSQRNDETRAPEALAPVPESNGAGPRRRRERPIASVEPSHE